MCKIDFSTTFLNKSFPHWLYDVLFVYGDIVYAIVSFLQDERNNTCFTRRHGGIRTMNIRGEKRCVSKFGRSENI